MKSILFKLLFFILLVCNLSAVHTFSYTFIDDGFGVKCKDDNGIFCRGWISEGDYIYWFDVNGYMITGYKTLEGTEYVFNDGLVSYAPKGALISDGVNIIERSDCSLKYVECRNTRFDNGRTLVLIHGLTGDIDNSLPFARHCTLLGFRVLVPQLVAHGSSNKISSVPEIIATSSKGIEEIISKNLDLNHEKAFIYGTSLGGMVGSCVVRDLKDKVEKLVLLVSTYDFSAISDKIFFSSYYKGSAIADLDRTQIKKLFDDINPNNDPDLFKGTKVYLVQSPTDLVIPYLENPKSEIDRHLTAAIGHGFKDSDCFESLRFLLKDTTSYIPTSGDFGNSIKKILGPGLNENGEAIQKDDVKTIKITSDNASIVSNVIKN